MTGERRQELKQAVDAEVRHRTGHGHQRTTCIGCAGHIDSYTDGCRKCRIRRYQRERRAA